MAVEAIKFRFFFSLCIYLFSFFLYSHLKTTAAQLISQHVMTKIKLLLLLPLLLSVSLLLLLLLLFLLLLLLSLLNTFSEHLINNLTNSFHIFMQRLVLLAHGGRSTDRQLTDCIFIVSCARGCPNKAEFSKKSYTQNMCGNLLPWKNKTNLCTRT
jgi:hypothetical protein